MDIKNKPFIKESEEKSPKVSIIIPVYNCEKYIEEAINSAINQSYNNYEVLVVDDGSTDNTPQTLEKYKNSVTLLRQEKSGQASALNNGIRKATGEYIALLDSDDVCMPDRISKQAKYLDNNSDIALVYSNLCQIDSNGSIIREISTKKFRHIQLLQNNYFARSSAMIRRKCLNTVGAFDEENSGNDDWDMWVRLSELYPMAGIDEVLIKYRIHDHNTSANRPNRMNFERYTKMRLRINKYIRCDKPLWLLVMVYRSKFEWIIGKIPFVGERFPNFWRVLSRLTDVIEYVIVKYMILLTNLIKRDENDEC